MKRKVLGKVTGINGKGEPIEFELDFKDVKHIRRCLKKYDYIHPRDNENDLIKRFMLFGRSNSGRKWGSKFYFKTHPEKYPKRCVECGTDKNLTIDHIVPLSAGGKDNIENYQYLCRKCHDIKNLKKRLDEKIDEMIILHNKLKAISAS